MSCSTSLAFDLSFYLRSAKITDIPSPIHQKTVGAFNLVQLKEGLEGFSLALFTHVLGWTVDQVQVLLAGVRADLSSKDVHAQNDMYAISTTLKQGLSFHGKNKG